MIFVCVLNPEKIWHQQPVHLSASPVYCKVYTKHVTTLSHSWICPCSSFGDLSRICFNIIICSAQSKGTITATRCVSEQENAQKCFVGRNSARNHMHVIVSLSVLTMCPKTLPLDQPALSNKVLHNNYWMTDIARTQKLIFNSQLHNML